ncbi:MAG: DUF1161 domain-containing protein [Desulfobulbaceae bacterium]|nr:DUF1161 domain-containing protein [Desulfobulbaceae bacterium]
MKRIIIALGVIAIFTTPAFAALKPCEELKGEIEAKLQAKGIKAYTLEILPNEQIKDHTVVGSCEGGSKKITYSRQ